MEVKITEAFNTFSNSILLIYTQKEFASKLYQKELSELNDVQRIISSQSLWYENILKNGEKTFLTYNQFEKNDIQLELLKSYNRQLQWGLVSAYECFQKYLDEVYSIFGYLDYSSWIAKDLGDITISELSNKDKCNLEWFRERTYKNGKRNISTESQLKQIRKYINVFSHYEIKGEDNTFCNYYFYFILITNLRHLIVHNNGIVKDKKKFNQRIFDKIKDLDNNFKHHKQNYERNIELFFGGEEFINTIFLTTTPKNYDRFKIIIDYLLSYSKFICDISILDLKDKNKMNR